MARHSKKADKRLVARIKDYESGNQNAGLLMHKPGSQNRKK